MKLASYIVPLVAFVSTAAAELSFTEVDTSHQRQRQLLRGLQTDMGNTGDNGEGLAGCWGQFHQFGFCVEKILEADTSITLNDTTSQMAIEKSCSGSDLAECAGECAVAACCFTDDIAKVCDVTNPEVICSEYKACEILYVAAEAPSQKTFTATDKVKFMPCDAFEPKQMWRFQNKIEYWNQTGLVYNMDGGCLGFQGDLEDGKNLKVMECDQNNEKQQWYTDGDNLQLLDQQENPDDYVGDNWRCVQATSYPIQPRDPVVFTMCSDSLDFGA